MQGQLAAQWEQMGSAHAHEGQLMAASRALEGELLAAARASEGELLAEQQWGMQVGAAGRENHAHVTAASTCWWCEGRSLAAVRFVRSNLH